MYWDIIEFEYLGDYRLRLTFRSGETGTVNLDKYASYGGVFSQLGDVDFFRRVYIDSGVLTWPNGADIAPETIYSLATGKPLPEWMEEDTK